MFSGIIEASVRLMSESPLAYIIFLSGLIILCLGIGAGMSKEAADKETKMILKDIIKSNMGTDKIKLHAIAKLFDIVT